MRFTAHESWPNDQLPRHNDVTFTAWFGTQQDVTATTLDAFAKLQRNFNGSSIELRSTWVSCACCAEAYSFVTGSSGFQVATGAKQSVWSKEASWGFSNSTELTMTSIIDFFVAT